MLQSDPALEDVGIVIFDEFHERSLHADLGLALTLQTRDLLRDDLRVLVMSATLDGEPVARLLADARRAGTDRHERGTRLSGGHHSCAGRSRPAARGTGCGHDPPRPACTGWRHPRIPPGRRRDRAHAPAARRCGTAAGRVCRAAPRLARPVRAGSRRRAFAGRCAQDRARDHHRANEPHDRRHPHRRRRRHAAGAAVLAPHRDEPPRDGARVTRGGRAAARAGGAHGARDVLPAVGRARACRPAAVRPSGDPRSRPRTARTRACGSGNRASRRSALARRAAIGCPLAGNGAAACTRRRRPGWTHHGARP